MEGKQNMIIEYIGLAEKVHGGYSIFFPDFAGFGSAGGTLEETRKNAREGLIGHIELMLEERGQTPQASSLDKIMALPEAKGCIPLVIGIVIPSGKAQRINITLDRALLDAIDLVAVNQHTTRSALFTEAAQKLLGSVDISLG
jgi:predicted RNase H-like HicB family nuclease